MFVWPLHAEVLGYSHAVTRTELAVGDALGSSDVLEVNGRYAGLLEGHVVIVVRLDTPPALCELVLLGGSAKVRVGSGHVLERVERGLCGALGRGV